MITRGYFVKVLALVVFTTICTISDAFVKSAKGRSNAGAGMVPTNTD